LVAIGVVAQLLRFAAKTLLQTFEGLLACQSGQGAKECR
jgi:hypothetical protein